jgi:LPXTG-site transpeptidase (sortase) family protein
MHKLISALSALLVVGGLGLLAYTGFAYTHPVSARAPSWNQQQKKAGERLAQEYSRRQRVTIPRRLAAVNAPVPGREVATRMAIPAIHLTAPVIQTPPQNGVWPVPDWAVGHLTSTPNPGARGNAAYSAHDDIKGEVFKRLGELKPGDLISLYTQHAKYTYTVTTQQVVDPSDVSVLAPTRNSTLTLISCTPYWVDTQRLIVHAALKSVGAT